MPEYSIEEDGGGYRVPRRREEISNTKCCGRFTEGQ